MNPNFSDWFRMANIEPNDQMLRNRWQGIQDFANQEINSFDVLNLVRLFFNIQVDDEFRNKFVNVFTDIDRAFPRQHNYELSVLAGVTLINIIESYENIDDLAMLAMQTMSFNGRDVSVPDILFEAKRHFDNKTADIREGLGVPNEIDCDVILNNILLKKLEEAKGGAAWNTKIMGESFFDYITALNEFLNEITKIYNNEAKQQSIYLEDSQILWWMTGEWSRDLKRPFSKLKVTEASIVAGKELADLVKILPGPYASRAVLHKTLSIVEEKKEANSTLTEIIDKQNNKWKEMVIKTYSPKNTKEITPILTAIAKSFEVDSSKLWLPAFKKITGCNADDIRMSPIDLAYQMYLECLVTKCIETIEG